MQYASVSHYFIHVKGKGLIPNIKDAIISLPSNLRIRLKTGKRMCQSPFFNKVARLRPATLLIKRLWHRCLRLKFVLGWG